MAGLRPCEFIFFFVAFPKTLSHYTAYPARRQQLIVILPRKIQPDEKPCKVAAAPAENWAFLRLFRISRLLLFKKRMTYHLVVYKIVQFKPCRLHFRC
jgi:hypothetical protein